MGALIWWIKVSYGEYLDSFVINGSMWAPITIMAITIFLIRVHPEPADACCKCFEDGVAFSGVFVGVKLGQWRSTRTQISIDSPVEMSIYLVVAKLAVKFVLGRLRKEILANVSQGLLSYSSGELQ